MALSKDAFVEAAWNVVGKKVKHSAPCFALSMAAENLI